MGALLLVFLVSHAARADAPLDVELVGNARTTEAFLRGELGSLVADGSPDEVRDRLLSLGLFEAVEATRDEATRRLHVRVREKPPTLLRLGIAADPWFPTTLQLQGADANLLGRGLDAHGELRVVSPLRVPLFRVGARERHLAGSPLSLEFEVFKDLHILKSYDHHLLGGSIGAGVTLAPHLRARLTWGLTQHEVVSAIATVTVPGLILWNSTTQSLRLTLDWDHRDDPLAPTRGYLVSGSCTWAPALGLLEDENVFQRLSLRAQGFWPLTESLRGSAAFLAGFTHLRDTRVLNLAERFNLGGSEQLRGFGPGSLGPTALTASSPDGPLVPFFLGGTELVLLIVELEWTLEKALDLRARAFVDAGNVRDPGDPLSLLASAGVALRFHVSPVDGYASWAAPLTPRDTNVGGVFGLGAGLSY